MTETRPIRVITVDDHEILRGGIRFALLAYDDLELVGEARSGEEALRLCSELRPDVVLMDMAMPGMDGIQTTQALLVSLPQAQVLALSSFHDPELVQRVMKAGAIGYLVKGISADRLAQAIREAHAGRPTLASEAVQALVHRPAPSPVPDSDLTAREREVLALLAAGLTNVEIAQRLTVSVSTVKYHLRGIYSKLGAANRAEAVALALDNRLIPSQPKASSRREGS
jgi:two-component system, NarL family, response regulator LiaR